MAKYIINSGYNDAVLVDDVASFRHQDGFFFFKDEEGEVVYVVSAPGVRNIKRSADK